MISKINAFSLRPADGDGAHLFFGDTNTGLAFNGLCIAEQFQVGGRYLIFLEADALTAETMSVYLLKPRSFTVLDKVSVGAPYVPGGIRDVAVVGRRAIEFSFFGTERWRLLVRAKPRRSIEVPNWIWRSVPGRRLAFRDIWRYRNLRLVWRQQ